jgi:hypothetical protein
VTQGGGPARVPCGLWLLVSLLVMVLAAQPARAQYIDTYLPTSVPGFNQYQGVTVLTQPRPAYDPLGVRAGDFILQPGLNESFGYNSNLLGTQTALGSTFLETGPSVDVASDWARDRIGLHASLDNTQYFQAPSQTHTDGSIGVGGSYTVGLGDASLGYTHLAEHENGTDIGAIVSQTPIAYNVDDVRGAVTLSTGTLAIIPNFDVSAFRFGNATAGGVSISQAYRDRVVATGGLTGRYDAGATGFIVVLQGVDSHYTEPPPAGQPSLDSRGGLALAGFDTAPDRIWRFRLLAGVEYRSFTAAQYRPRTEPVVEGTVVWSPSRTVTVTGTLSRSVEAPQSDGTSGYVYDNAHLVTDYELRRNFLLQARLGFQAAEFLQGGGTQTIASAGAGATWLLNRNIHLTLSYDYTREHGPAGGIVFTGLVGGSYTDSRAVLLLHFAL